MSEYKKQLFEFLQSQKVLIIASSNDEDVWISNVYYGIDENFNFYFSSGKNSYHSKQILNNSKVSFSVVWYDESDFKNRKAVQGKGTCTLATELDTITNGVKIHNENFPEFKERVTIENISNVDFPSKIWKIEIKYIKFWNDELFGENGTKEFKF